MVGAHLGTMLDQMRADGEDRIANEIEDAVEHDYHDMRHDGEFYQDCWFCWNEAMNGYGEWPFGDLPPKRMVEEDEAL